MDCRPLKMVVVALDAPMQRNAAIARELTAWTMMLATEKMETIDNGEAHGYKTAGKELRCQTSFQYCA
jgi:hypothetical protein